MNQLNTSFPVNYIVIMRNYFLGLWKPITYLSQQSHEFYHYYQTAQLWWN